MYLREGWVLMSKIDEEIEYKILENLYSDIREWLKFAESKNAALLTLNIASFFGIVRMVGKEDFSCIIKIILILLLFSTIINLRSFFPSKVKDKSKSGRNYRLVNLLYYADISKLDLKRTQEYLGEKYYAKEIKIYEDLYFDDLTKQIYSLSVITDRKNTYFKGSLRITILSFALLMSTFIL